MTGIHFYGGHVRTVHPGPVTVLPAAAVVLMALAATVGLRPASILAGSAVAVVTWLLLEHGMRATRLARLGPANAVTLVRAAAVAGLTALVVESWSGDVPAAVLVTLISVALVLDLVDGRMARARGSVTVLGAAFDMETDAFLILVLSVYAVPLVGAWVLLTGLARYLLLVASAFRPWLGTPVPPRRWAKVVAAVQGVALFLVATGLLPTRVAQGVLGAALVLLAESFAHQVGSARRHRSEATTARPSWAAPATDVLAVSLLWLVLALPARPGLLSLRALAAIPVELLVFVALAMVLPRRWGRLVAVLCGVTLATTFVVTLLDLAFFAAFDRPFDLLSDPFYAVSGLDLLQVGLGGLGRAAVLAVIALVVVGSFTMCVWATLRTRRSVRRRPAPWTRLVAALGVVWAVAAVAGAHLGGVPVAAAPAATLISGQVEQVRADLRDRALFEHRLTHDPYAATPGSHLLRGLRGKDVLVVFVESYGKVAVQDTWFSPPVDRRLTALDSQLAGLGFGSRSAWLGSPTFGGLSWLAHSTLQTGLWIDHQQRYEQVLGSDRLSLAGAFRRAGWHTVGDIPSDPGPWPEGQAFYRYRQMLNASDVGYVGPRYGYARVPDQYTFAAFDRLVLSRKHRRPVMAEIDLDSSHTPWSVIPRIVPWDQIGDGSVYRRSEAPTSSTLRVLGDSRLQQASYARSIRYSLSSLVSFVRNAHDPNLVLVVLGDHQPNSLVSGTGVSHDVPISLVAHDPRVLHRIEGWGWTPGLHPASNGVRWPMDAFRDRFLGAFGSTPSGPVDPGPATTLAAP
jgi:phosphatidylglycerophosphate synthase